MGSVGGAVDAVLRPELVVVCGDGGVFLGVGVVLGQGGDLGHGLEGDDALDGQIGLVGELAGEVVGGELVVRDLGVFDEVFRPLAEELVVVVKVLNVVGFLGVDQSQEDHVSAFLEGHLLVVALVVAKSLGVVAQIVDSPLVRVATAALVLEHGVEEPLDVIVVEVHQGRHSGEHDIGSLNVAIRANLLDPDLDVVGGARVTQSTECLASSKGSDGSVVITTDLLGVVSDLVVHIDTSGGGILVVGVEEGDDIVFVVEVACPQRREGSGLGSVAPEEDVVLLGEADGEDGALPAVADAAEIAGVGKDGPAVAYGAEFSVDGVGEGALAEEAAADGGVLANLVGEAILRS